MIFFSFMVAMTVLELNCNVLFCEFNVIGCYDWGFEVSLFAFCIVMKWFACSLNELSKLRLVNVSHCGLVWIEQVLGIKNFAFKVNYVNWRFICVGVWFSSRSTWVELLSLMGIPKFPLMKFEIPHYSVLYPLVVFRQLHWIASDNMSNKFNII